MMKVGDWPCSRCGHKGTLQRKGTELFQCSYCGAPYIIKGVETETPKKTQTQSQTEKMIAARKRLEALRNKHITDVPKRVSVAVLEKLRAVQDLAAWAHIPMPAYNQRERDPEAMFDKYDLVGTKIIDKATNKTVFDFRKARDDSKSMLWGIDERKYVW